MKLYDFPLSGHTHRSRLCLSRISAMAALARRDWIAADRPTIADVALYSYIARAPEGHVGRFRYGRVTAWLKRVVALPGFAAFPKSATGIPDPDQPGQGT